MNGPDLKKKNKNKVTGTKILLTVPMIGLRTDFTSSVWNFLSLSRRRSTLRNVSSGGERGGTPFLEDCSFCSFGFIFEKKMGC